VGTQPYESQIDPPDAAAPRLRGVAHLVAFVAAAPVGILLVAHARGGPAHVGAATFAANATVMLGVSSLFHRRAWSPKHKRWLAAVDHAMIYALIAGTYTPFALLVLDHGWRLPILAIVWGGAFVAAAGKLLRPDAPRSVSAATCVALGWISVLVLPQIVGRIGLGPTALLAAGGIAYTVGAVVYARRKPDPFPRVFGYHELFHALTVVALACQYATIAFFVLPRA